MFSDEWKTGSQQEWYPGYTVYPHWLKTWTLEYTSILHIGQYVVKRERAGAFPTANQSIDKFVFVNQLHKLIDCFLSKMSAWTSATAVHHRKHQICLVWNLQLIQITDSIRIFPQADSIYILALKSVRFQLYKMLLKLPTLPSQWRKQHPRSFTRKFLVWDEKEDKKRKEKEEKKENELFAHTNI